MMLGIAVTVGAAAVLGIATRHVFREAVWDAYCRGYTACGRDLGYIT